MRDLRGMTDEWERVPRLVCQQNMSDFQPLYATTAHLTLACGISADGLGGRRSFAPSLATKAAGLQAVLTGATGLEPATSGVTGRRSNQLNYAPRARLV
jgi:hypothetical protein